MIVIDFFRQLTVIQTIMLLLFLFSFIFQMFYYWLVFGKVAFFKKINGNNYKVNDGVSIIICAHNECENLRRNLPVILEQNYPVFEVIVILNNCADDSDIVIAELKRKYGNLECRTISRSQYETDEKKLCLLLGVRVAKYDKLLLTNADCYPLCNNWLQNMQSNFSDKKQVVIGYVRYTNSTKAVRCDLFFRAIHYLGMAAIGRAYMGCGQNLGYTKKICLEKIAIDSRITTQCEDVVIVNRMTDKKNTAMDISSESIVESTYRYAMNNWLFERNRLAKTFKFYGSKNRYPLFFELLSRIIFYFSLIFLILQSGLLIIFVALLWFVRLLSQIIIFYKSQKRLKEKRMIVSMLLYDIISPFAIGFFKFAKK